MHNTIFYCFFQYGLHISMDLSFNLLKSKESRAKPCREQDSRWIYQVVKMLRVAVMRTVLLISGGPLPVPVASPIAFRQGARVAGTSACAPAPSVDTGQHRRSLRTRSSLESVRLLTTQLNLTAG